VYVNYAQIRSCDQPVLSNEGNIGMLSNKSVVDITL